MGGLRPAYFFIKEAMALKPKTIELVLELLSRTSMPLIPYIDDIESSMLFGVPIGALECETALAALVKYGVEDEAWEMARKMYLKLLEKHDLK